LLITVLSRVGKADAVKAEPSVNARRLTSQMQRVPTFHKGGAMQYDRELIEDLREIAILYHASSLLSYKLQEVLDRHIPHLGETCMERGCVDYTLA